MTQTAKFLDSKKEYIPEINYTTFFFLPIKQQPAVNPGSPQQVSWSGCGLNCSNE
jgi:hypothetical protein